MIEVEVLLDLFCQTILRLVASCQNNIILGDSERPDEFDQKEDNLDATDDGESCEEPHGASDETQLGLRLDLLFSLDVVEGCCAEVDLHKLKS